MSRGHGKLQRFILDGVLAQPDRVFRAQDIAALYAAEHGDDSTPHLRASVRRAIRRLCAEGLVEAGQGVLPTRKLADGSPHSYRYALCVWAPGAAWRRPGRR